MIKILVTGSMGFIGKNLVAELQNRGFADICEYDAGSDPSLLDDYCANAGFVFHLAGVNRPKQESEFMEGNFGFTSVLLETLIKHGNKCPVMMASSIQAALDNPYGRSKKAGEELMFSYGKETGAEVLVYRFPNIFGKWSRPDYNSAVATFCSNAANDLPLQVHDPDVVLNLAYIDDVVKELIDALEGRPERDGDYCRVSETYTVKVGDVADLIRSFKTGRETLGIPDMSDSFTRKLHSTYLSFLPPDRFSYPLDIKSDNRGCFAEFLKTPDRGQISVNIAKPGVTKGNHWHHTKIEKFLVVSGRAVIRFRRVGTKEITEYHVNGDKLEVVDIPAGYTHHVENLGDTDLVTIMWANEQYDPENPDTYFLEV